MKTSARAQTGSDGGQDFSKKWPPPAEIRHFLRVPVAVQPDKIIRSNKDSRELQRSAGVRGKAQSFRVRADK